MVHLEESRPNSGRREPKVERLDKTPAALELSQISQYEQIHCQPYGIPHKRIGDVILPAFLKTDQLFDLEERWQVGEKDVLLALSPGLFPNIQVLEPLFELAGDPMPQEPAGPVQGACAFRERMLELIDDKEVRIRGASGARCLFSLLPPWLLPQSFGKVAVFLADPRYLIMRQLQLWEMFKRCHADKGKGCGCATLQLQESDFLRSYLEEDCSLSGEEMTRLARWALEEYRQPDKVKIFFVEDFVAEPDVALRGLARFLGVPDDAEVLEKAISKLEAMRPHGLFYPRQDMLELQHFLTVTHKFEQLMADLPSNLQSIWEERVSLWPRLPNLRLATLGQSLQNHRMWVAPQWWAAHSAELCKPCSFAPRGICRSGEDCEFCHAPSHRAPLRRPSKKERLRRMRKSARESEGSRGRTPSPDGLSS
ncbi:unnamed protein product [Effrenium voratum]|uniref:C3H1-type domain-containing protein n=1 Tax=Effrenium voratum TaxID=2562239 RepID=A0AA36J191_9DINO|nr:unnamed protein product [Effrenium voratum]CAJ1424049.1 unnamed protein product [Effrenium voratum]